MIAYQLADLEDRGVQRQGNEIEHHSNKILLDKGCRYSPKCLECPLPDCVMDTNYKIPGPQRVAQKFNLPLEMVEMWDKQKPT